MKCFVAVVSCLVYGAVAAPSAPLAYGGVPAALGYAPAGLGYAAAIPAVKAPACRVEYETVTTKQCSTSYEKQCRTETKTKYRTEYEQQCQTITRQNCYPVAKSVPDTVCAVRGERVCTQETQKTYDVKLEQNCQDVVRKVCGGAVVAPAYGLAAPAARLYKRDASGPYGYGCKEVKDRVCSAAPVKSPRYVEVPRCQVVPKKECKDITRQATEIKCDPIEENQCTNVPKQASVEVPIEICEEVPMENCVDVPKQVPKKICKEYSN